MALRYFIILSLLLGVAHARVQHVEHVRTGPTHAAPTAPRPQSRRFDSVPGSNPVSFGTAISQGHYGTEETEVFSKTVSDWSVMSHFWITGGGKIDDVFIRYYVDNEVNASIALEPGYACGVGFGDTDGAPYGVPGMGKGAKTGGWYFDHKIPFKSNIRVTIQVPQIALPSGQNTTIVYLILRGLEGVQPVVDGRNLGPSKLTLHKIVNQKVQPLEYVNLVDLPTGSGMIYMTTIAVSSGNLNFLEGCFRVLSPYNTSYPGWLVSSGTEDYFNSAYYFNAGKFYLPDAGYTHINTTDGTTTLSAYKMHTSDPIYFQDGLKYVWRNGDAWDPATGLKCTIETGGNVVGSPTVSTIITYVWVYTNVPN